MAENKLSDDHNTLTVDEEREEFISFILGDETFGVDVLKVHEIIGMTEITPVPDSVHYMKGVINLRGNVVPVVDMRLRFNMEVIEYTHVTVIIIVEVNERFVGMIVDTVSDVVGIPTSNIHESSSLSSDMEINSEFIQAIGQVDNQLIIILDVTRILESESGS
ncbi:MAG: chemotaxis protein CheW [Spirochaetae bacterium HGW-Spirochaetae-1]|jgi:purine-binding chemotaxis protein CheW|nr:MAG: chemotaxis protein CheW [Spirochaetae bacterium HGW-Spirochaetae-1]